MCRFNRIVVTSGTVELSVAQWSADGPALAELYNSDSTLASVWIADTASEIDAVLSSLTAATQVARIVVTSGEVQVSAANASSLALAKLYGSNGVAALVSVSDSAAILSDQLDALNLNARVNSVAIGSGGALTLAAATVATDATALGEIAGGYTVAISDTAAQVSAYLGPIRANGHVTSIALLGGGTPTLTIGQAVFINDAATVAEITGTFALDVTGVTVSQVSAVEAAFNGLINRGSGSLSIAITDAAAQLTSDELTALGSDAAVQSISITSGTLALQQSQFVSDSAGLDKVIGNWSVAVSGATVSQISATENDFAALNDAGGGTLAIGVNDSGIALNDNAFSSLGGDADVHSIAVSDYNAIHLTESQFVADLAGLTKLTGIWAAIAFDATVTQVGALEADFVGLPDAEGGALWITVDDIASNLTNAALGTLGADMHVNNISITGGGTLTLTEGEFSSAANYCGVREIRERRRNFRDRGERRTGRHNREHVFRTRHCHRQFIVN